MKLGIYAYALFLRDSASYKYIYKIKYSNNSVLVHENGSNSDVYKRKTSNNLTKSKSKNLYSFIRFRYKVRLSIMLSNTVVLNMTRQLSQYRYLPIIINSPATNKHVYVIYHF